LVIMCDVFDRKLAQWIMNAFVAIFVEVYMLLVVYKFKYKL